MMLLRRTLPEMQPGSNPAAAFLRDGFSFSLSVFDTTRGQKEDDEYDKVLSFYPTTAALSVRTTIVGLAQAITTFAGNFAPGDEGFKVLEGEHQRWVMVPCEPNIWLLLVVSKAWVGRACATVALQEYLKRLYSLFVLLHGRIGQLLEQDTTAHSVRRVLQPFLDEAGALLASPDPRQPAALSNPLGQHEGLPLLATSHRTFLSAQCLANQLLATPYFGGAMVTGAVITWHNHLLLSSLEPLDTSALFHLSLHIIRNKAKGKSAIPGSGRSHAATLLSPSQWQTEPSRHTSSASLSSVGSGRLGVFLSPLPRTHSAQSSDAGSSGSLASPPAVMSSARVWLQESNAWAQLLPYTHGPLAINLILPDRMVITQDILMALGDVFSRWVGSLSSHLAADVPGYNLWHVPGYRYSFTDAQCNAARASPAKKVATLSPASLRLLAEVHNACDLAAPTTTVTSSAVQPLAPPATGSSSATAAGTILDTAAGTPAPHLNGSVAGRSTGSNAAKVFGSRSSHAADADARDSDGGEYELVVRSRHDCFVVARQTQGGRRLLVALEQPPEQQLLPATARVDALCDTVFPGVFNTG